ncbi:MAG: Xaa-Pro peptidase family protein [Sneathiella sp.]
MTEADFQISEFEARLNCFQKGLHKLGVDAALFTSEAEMRYFTGFRTLFWQSPTRPWFLIVPAAGKPIAIIPEIGAALMQSTWIDDIRSWASPHADDDGVSLVTDALQGVSRVGMMMGRESYLRMPLSDFEKIRTDLKHTDIVDISPLIQSVRMVKSAAEIEKISEICTIASTSFDQASELFYEGKPLKECFRSFKIDLLKQGAEDVPYLVGGAGQGGYGDVISPPSMKPLEKGDIFMLDTGATLAGYFCDFDRNFAIGAADDSSKYAYKRLFDATDAAIQIARPGVTCRELFAAMAEVVGDVGGSVGRFGHGLGMQLTEAPSLISFDETVLKENMVITLEPSMQIGADKMMVHEENILITDGEARLLTKRAAPELPIL